MEIKKFKKSIGSKKDVEIINKKHLWVSFKESANNVLDVPKSEYSKETKCAFSFTKENKEIVLTILRYFAGDDDFNEFGVVKNNASLSKGLLITGDLGVGKTVLFRIISEVGKDLFKRFKFKKSLFRSISCGSFVSMYMTSTKMKHLEFNLDSFHKGGLYIDDLGFETLAFNSYELLEKVIFERYRNEALTFITTNLSMLEIHDRYGARISDRLPEMCNVINWKGESFRAIK